MIVVRVRLFCVLLRFLEHLIAYLDYDFEEDDDFAEVFRRAIANHEILVARNHGYYTIDGHAAEAFFRAIRRRHTFFTRAAEGGVSMGLLCYAELS